MTQERPPTVRPLPGWIILLGTAFAGSHLLAIMGYVLASQSGPWPVPYGQDYWEGPHFAGRISNLVRPQYLEYLKMTHNYHFDANRLNRPAVTLEVRLKDEKGKVVRTVRIPEDGANPWVRHRQILLAQALGADEPYMNRAGEAIAAPGRQAATVTYWTDGGNRTLKLETRPEHLVPREPMVLRPSEWSLVLAKAYMRHLCREHNAASAELIRHHRDAVQPMALIIPWPEQGLPEQIRGTFDDQISNFGEQRRED